MSLLNWLWERLSRQRQATETWLARVQREGETYEGELYDAMNEMREQDIRAADLLRSQQHMEEQE